VAAVISRSVPRQPRRRQAMGLRFATRGRATLLNRGSATEAVAPIFDLGSHPVRSIDILASAFQSAIETGSFIPCRIPIVALLP
jgi:hypothetical protein